MSMDYIDLKNANRTYCPDCQEEHFKDSEEHDIAMVTQEDVLCEECQKLEDANNEAAKLSETKLTWYEAEQERGEYLYQRMRDMDAENAN